ncbi:unnamed protein product [Prunus brigantina]
MLEHGVYPEEPKTIGPLTTARVGKIKWDPRLIREAIENGGGGWHGQGWLGKGKWSVLRTTIGADGLCK